MKRIIIIAVCLVMATPCFAQWDIKVFDKIGKDAIISLLGTPEPEKKYGGFMDGVIDVDYFYSTQYPGTVFVLDENTLELVGFNTDSPAFCVLSDYIPGGFKVGDSLEKLQSFDFAHSVYGKNKPENALTLIDSTSERDYYEVYGQEMMFFFFSVKNGIIIGVDMGTVEEDFDSSDIPWHN